MVGLLIDNKPQYLVSWQIEFGLYVSLDIATILAMLNLVVTPTTHKYLLPLKNCEIVNISALLLIKNFGFLNFCDYIYNICIFVNLQMLAISCTFRV